jgi:hypothetical protein
MCICHGNHSSTKPGEFKYFMENLATNRRISSKLKIWFEPREAFLSKHLAVEHFLKRMLLGLDIGYRNVHTGTVCPGINFNKKYFTHDIKLIVSDLSKNISDLPLSEANNLIAALSIPSYFPLGSPRPTQWAEIRYFDPNNQTYNKQLSKQRRALEKEFGVFYSAVIRKVPKCCW